MQDADFKPCPFCKETIRIQAVKCRFCGEWLEQLASPAPNPPAGDQTGAEPTPGVIAAQIQPEVTINQKQVSTGEPAKSCAQKTQVAASDASGRKPLPEPDNQYSDTFLEKQRANRLKVATLIYGVVLLFFLITSATPVWDAISKNSEKYNSGRAIFDFIIYTFIQFVGHAFLSPLGIICLAVYGFYYQKHKKPKKSIPEPATKDSSLGQGAADAKTAITATQSLEPRVVPPETGQQSASKPKEGECTVAKAKHPNYFIRHWRGDLSLGVSYWANGMLGTFLVLLAVGTLTVMQDTVSLKLIAALALLIYAIALVVTVWQLVGVWRSASNHVSRGGRSGWATAAKVAVVFGILNCIGLFWNTCIPQSAEWVRILAGDKSIPAYEIRVLPGGTEIEYRGGLRAGCARELEKILTAVPQAKVLHIESIGGRITEAKAMMKLVHDRGMITYTSDYCLSAATLVLMSGKERVIEAGAKVGFHAGTFPGLTSDELREINEIDRKTMQSAGVSEAFISRVLSTPAEQMWYPTYDEMRAAGVITSQSLGDRFASSLGMPDVDLEAVIKDVSAYPCFRTIKKVEPETFDIMMTNFMAALRAGKSEGEAIGMIQDAASSLMIKYFPAASDEAVLGLRNQWIEILTRYKDKNSAACIAVFTQQKINYKRVFPDWNMTNSLLVVEKIISSGADGTTIPIDKTAADEDMATVMKPVTDKYGDDAQLLYKQETWHDNSQKVCDMLLMMYQQEAALPDKRSANLIRYLITSN